MKNYWFLIKELSITDFKLRYNNSILGYLWSLLNPLLMFMLLYVVFSLIIRFDNIEYYQLYLLLGIILWTYFVEATTNGMTSMQYKSSLISKINFPKWIILVASNLTSLLSLILNLVVLVIFIIIAGIKPSWNLFFFAIFMLQLLLMALGVSFFLGAFYLKFRDIKHIWEVLLQIGFWATPIIYPVASIPAYLKDIIFLNPLANIITNSRNVIIYNVGFSPIETLITTIVIIIILVISILIFNKRSLRFAEEL
ncbi:ABC transporter permease [Candidatus Woesearchaeota archaeon]|nr:ABC transporter permease [Candidatus Woesearchaeota archaeon]